MKRVKEFFSYLTWVLIALFLGIGYMRIILGINDISSEGIGFLYHLFYSFGLLHIGLIIGGIIAVLFILLDVLCLKEKLKDNAKETVFRFGFLLVITIFIGIIHSILEKVINVI